MKNILILITLIILILLAIVFLGNKKAESPTNEVPTTPAVEEAVVSEETNSGAVVNENTNTVESQEKIDATVACRATLTYMSFPNGEAANIFIDECIAGKHPEVIERYKVEMQVSSEATI